MQKNKIETYLQLHLFELKYNFFILFFTFFYLFIISYYFSDQLIYLLVNNLLNKNMLKYFIFTNITEIFITNIFIASFISIFITVQLSIVLIWLFVSTGLYKFENFIIIKFYFLFIIFNFFIINFIFTNIIPHIWNFLLNLNFTNLYILTVYFEPKINNYFHFIFSAFIYIFIIFIYIFILFFLIFNNILKIKLIINLRKFFYLKIILVSVLMTPPDFINFIIISLLFIYFFEIFIFILIYFKKYNKLN
uniref:Sec-independent transporter protein n=1 Tax=Phytophthora captiosa TaxID=360400 RepID=G4X5M6_9STRA|nr:sec-independent transporter protein [Phytophthora captiosa]AEP41061.1 SecY [Phytophthora captiosa]AEP41062.1 SecY [Phytophthora captiosa]AFQ02364.1 SecY [Phytophthora captiosa]QPN54008.1 sec-independent transporter protein [Phytophthora captiosa]